MVTYARSKAIENLWAPWRMVYIESFNKKRGGKCFICEACMSRNPQKTLTLELTHDTVVVMNLYPYNPGHLLVAPRSHVEDFDMLNDSQMLDMLITLRKWIKLLKKALRPDGFNLGANLGEDAGAGLPEHLHVHVVPRWKGDTNFMPTTASTKVVPELLEDTYNKLSSMRRKLA
ncbi:MAG: HIT domain-containing protein [Candidatus Marsarchaeota archaeon]|nr:HIT domain-containing protein [Candidatus Marsarchaeota archaeon]